MAQKLGQMLLSLLLFLHHLFASPVPLDPAKKATAQVIRMPMFKRPSNQLFSRQTVGTGITNEWLHGEPYYYVQVGVGTPAQPLSLLVDTGSSDTWLYGPNYCGSYQCCKLAELSFLCFGIWS
jgi:Eukaryotic aspartyl protease